MGFSALLLDLEGVLYQDDTPVPGAVAALEDLRRSGRALRFLTNTTTRPRRAIAERLAALGFEVALEEVFSPPAAASRVLQAMGAKRIHLAAAASLAEDFADFELDPMPTPTPPDLSPPDAIVLGDLYQEFTWQRLDDLFTQLAAGASLIALHKNRVSRRGGGIALDLGPFVAALEYAADVRAQVVGKPSRQFFDLAVGSMEVPSAQVLMVGDDIESDIGGALGAGLSAVQVRTGKYRARDDEHPYARPQGRIDSIVDLAAWLESYNVPV